jgi:tetratricopeptide (TPR) repeat protein
MSSANSETAVTDAPAGQLRFALMCLVLALGTAALYWPITRHPFIQFDDEQYIISNTHVNSGLSATNFVWAFTTSEQANWHPLTWLSHQLDCTLFGVGAGGHHLVNLLYHVANTLLLFVFLRGATGAFWRSAFVAALFAWHPLHVESVAWAAERKDVLCAFFWLLALLAYLGYARRAGRCYRMPQTLNSGLSRSPKPANAAHVSGPAVLEITDAAGLETCSTPVSPAAAQTDMKYPGRGAAWFYVAALIFCACSLMSKPMAVTLPCVLLLLDLWPLNRIANFQAATASPGVAGCRPVPMGRLVLEKAPFFALAISGSLATYIVQAGAGAVAGLPVGERLANAVLAYASYTAKLFWPTDLALIYPHPRHWPAWLALGAMAVLLVWTFLCVYNWRKRPFLAVGWFWFLGTLVPTVGLIQVGAQAMADRYTYLPSIGVFIVVAWGAAEYFSARSSGKFILPLAGGAALLGCAGATACEISLWRDSVTLFRHAIEVTTDNYVAENCLGKTYEKMGDPRALACYQLSVKTEPRFPYSQFNLAMALLERGQTAEALEHLKIAGALEPRDPDIQYDLGIYFSQHASWPDAVNCFSNSLSVRPDFAPAQLSMGNALANLGRTAAAVYFREALRLDPKLITAQTNLERFLSQHPEAR